MKIIIEGMSCSHCVHHVKEALLELDGVTKVEVDLENNEAIVKGDVSEEAIREAIEEAGYDVVEIEE